MKTRNLIVFTIVLVLSTSLLFGYQTFASSISAYSGYIDENSDGNADIESKGKLELDNGENSVVLDSDDIQKNSNNIDYLHDEVSQLNSNLGNCTFSVDENGAYVTYTPTGGADSVTKKLGSPEVISQNYTGYVSVPKGKVSRNITTSVNVHKDGYIPIGGGITSTSLWADEGVNLPTTIYTLTGEIATVGIGCGYNNEDASSSSGTINFTIFYITI